MSAPPPTTRTSGSAADRAVCNLEGPQFAADTDWGRVAHRRCARPWSDGHAACNLGPCQILRGRSRRGRHWSGAWFDAWLCWLPLMSAEGTAEAQMLRHAGHR
jgi:hypothetical protein